MYVVCIYVYIMCVCVYIYVCVKILFFFPNTWELILGFYVKLSQNLKNFSKLILIWIAL